MSYIGKSLYADYLLERQGALIVENSLGFIIYKTDGEDCLIMETFIVKEERKKGAFSNLFNRLLEKIPECKNVGGKIYVNDPNHTQTLHAALSFGFEVVKAQNDVITICKRVGE